MKTKRMSAMLHLKMESSSIYTFRSRYSFWINRVRQFFMWAVIFYDQNVVKLFRNRMSDIWLNTITIIKCMQNCFSRETKYFQMYKIKFVWILKNDQDYSTSDTTPYSCKVFLFFLYVNTYPQRNRWKSYNTSNNCYN